MLETDAAMLAVAAGELPAHLEDLGLTEGAPVALVLPAPDTMIAGNAKPPLPRPVLPPWPTPSREAGAVAVADAPPSATNGAR
jgi:hypothetical protein